MDRLAVEGGALDVADHVGGRPHLGHQPAELLEHAEHGVGVDVAEGLELGQPVEVDDVLEEEADVASGGTYSAMAPDVGLRIRFCVRTPLAICSLARSVGVRTLGG